MVGGGKSVQRTKKGLKIVSEHFRKRKSEWNFLGEKKSRSTGKCRQALRNHSKARWKLWVTRQDGCKAANSYHN